MLWGRIGAIAQKFTITKVYGRFEEELKFKTTITGDTIHYTRYTATLYPVLVELRRQKWWMRLNLQG